MASRPEHHVRKDGLPRIEIGSSKICRCDPDRMSRSHLLDGAFVFVSILVGFAGRFFRSLFSGLAGPGWRVPLCLHVLEDA
jgi:hypothetical protein